MPHKVLIVDDEEDILDFLSYNLKKEGYEVAVAHNGKIALELVEKFNPDLVFLDIMMPDLDGIQTCKKIRANPNRNKVKIAFLTARSEDQMQVTGLDVGADDFIAKPIKISVLLSRTRALLRRGHEKNEVKGNEIIHLHDLVIDPVQMLVFKGKEKFEFAKKEFLLLYLLASRPGKVFKRDEILAKIWGTEVIVGDRTIDVHIRKIREKLGDNYIKTVKGIGYKIEF